MKKMKKKIIILFSFLIIIFFLLGLFLITQNVQNKFAKKIKDNFPVKIKIFFKEKIFYYPLKIRKSHEMDIKYKKLFSENKKLLKENRKIKNKLNLGKFENLGLKSYFAQSVVIPYDLEDDYNLSKNKGYIEIFKNKIIVAYSSGKILYFNKNNFETLKLDFKEINTNLTNLIYFDNELIWSGIKDLKIIEDYLYVSLTEEIKKDCYNTSLLSAKINFEYLSFEKIYSSQECSEKKKRIAYFKYFNGHQTGGRIEWLDKKIYLTVGDYNNWKFPQNNESDFGKILEIDPISKKYRIISKGHRNAQGLKILSKEKKLLISTEHGPKGGDEINIIDINQSLVINNYGWPKASYGKHYDVVPINAFTKKYAPLNINHMEHGFIEPIYYFKESIGISEIIKNYYSKERQYFVTSLKNKKIYVFEEKNKTFRLVKKIDLGERIRDIIFDKESSSYFLYLENTPKIVKLNKIK
jgi:hypothetical protein